jgi:archaetidylinositol phosphate synthase
MQDRSRQPGETRFREAGREHTSLLAALEKRLLVNMAHRAPAWLNSDHLTLLGFVSMLLAGVFYWLARGHRLALLAVIAFLALNWLGDSLDGTLARVRNRQRPRYGFYVDHVTDAFGTLFLVGGMALSGYMSPLVAAGLLILYYLLSIQAYLATYCLGTFRLSYWKFGPTELRVLIAIGNLALFFRPTVWLFGKEFLLFDVGGVIGIVGMALPLIIASVRNTAALYRAEPFPPR